MQNHINNQKKNNIDTYRSETISDQDFEHLNSLFYCLRKSDSTFHEYKRHYNEMCNLCKIPSENSIIVSEKFIKGDNNKNTVEIRYSTKTKRIIIPQGYTLYHQSPANNITELIPQFRGKFGKGYLYSEPRIYFSLRKLPKICADVSHKTEMTLYTPATTISTAMIDPLLSNFGFGAVYIPTQFPIKVEKIASDEKTREMHEYTEEGNETVFKSIDEFMTFYGLEYAVDELYEESISARVGNFLRKRADKKFVKNNWKSEQSRISSGWKTIYVNDQNYEQIRKLWNIATTTDRFSIYKHTVQHLLSFFKISGNGIVINRMEYKGKSDEGMHTFQIQTHSGARKIIIPNGTLLIHCSPTENIAELKPSFRSRTRGRFLYPDQRVYFSLGKPIKSSKAGLENRTTFKYTPRETVQTAYIDPAASQFSTGAVYLLTNTNIPVISLEKKSEEIQKK